MAKRIVIIPSFASSHFLKCWVPNMIETLNPDIIIVNEGLFPDGPENKGHIDDKFREKWCFENTNCGFDWIETNLQWTNEERFDTKRLSINEIKYIDNLSADNCFLQAISTFHRYQPELGDLIFPLEPDAFIWEGDIERINVELEQLKPGEGLSCKWVDLLETQHYTEAINLIQPKYRRFAYCFDNVENYRVAMSGFMSQNYSKLKKTDSFFIRHYCWFMPEPYKQLRYELIHRSDPQYWKSFDSGLHRIRRESLRIQDGTAFRITETPLIDKILIRPSRTDEGRWAKFIDILHPNVIKHHPNFVK